MRFIFFLVEIVIAYFVIKYAVKHAIRESLEDIRITVKDSIVGAINEYEYKNEKK